MGVNSDVEHYLCEQCEPRSVNRVKKKKVSSSLLQLQTKAALAFIFIEIGKTSVGFSFYSVASLV